MPSETISDPANRNGRSADSAIVTIPTAMIAPPSTRKILRRRNRSERNPPPSAPAVVASTPMAPRVPMTPETSVMETPSRSAKKNAVKVVFRVRPK